MNLIQRYVQTVIAFLPAKQQAEVAQELTSHIMDMVADSQNESDEATIQILESLGSPRKLADSYLNRSNYLIGPRYFGVYHKILKIVLFAISVAFTVVFAVRIVFSETITWTTFLEYIATLFNGGMIGFAYVTFIFSMLERYEVKLDEDNEDTVWRVSQLSTDVQVDKTNLFENLFELVFTTALLFIINFHPAILSFPQVDGLSNSVIPLFNESMRASWIGLINVWLLIGVLRAIVTSVKQLGSKRLLYLTLFLDGLGLIVFLIIVFTQEVINPNFAAHIVPGNEALVMLFQRGSQIVVFAIIAMSGYELLSSGLKLIKYKHVKLF